MIKKYKINESYFEKIDSKDKAYFLGLLYSDGCNFVRGKNARSIILSLQEKDRDILDTFKKYTKSNHKLRHISSKGNRQGLYILCINSLLWGLTLDKLGCVPNKSLILQFPTEEQVPKEFHSHFIRGLFDGDGCV